MGDVTKLSDARKKRANGPSGGRRKGGGEPPWVAELREAVKEVNKSFALVLVGDKALVLRQYADEDGRDVVGFLTVSSLRTWLENRRFPIDEDRDAGLGELWLKARERREYEGVAFAPPCWSPTLGAFGTPDLPERWYNLWKGFAVPAAHFYSDPREHAKHFRTLFDHVLRNVARGDKGIAKWVWGWFAHMIQRPTERLGAALVLRGKEGVGKSTLGDVVGHLLGRHYVLIDDPDHLVGKFNAHLLQCLLLQADEGFWAGDVKAAGKLKGLVTSKVHLVEKKGVDAVPIRNLVHLLVTSNNSWVVPAGFEARRWAVLDIGEGNMQDKPFFRQLYAELESGGYSHLLAYLLRFDLASVNLAEVPRTEALFEQKIASMSEVQSWWLDRLRDGKLLPQHGKWLHEVATDPLYGSYVAYADRLGKGRKLTKEQFGRDLGKLMPEKGFKREQKLWVPVYGPDGEHIRNADGSSAMRRANGYHIPPLRECREHFCGLLRHDIDWAEDDSTEAVVGGGVAEGGGAGGGASPSPSGGRNGAAGAGERADPFALDDG